MTPRFFTRVYGRIKLPLTEKGKAMAGINLGKKVRSLVWDMLNFKCLINIQMEMSGREVDYEGPESKETSWRENLGLIGL